MYAQLTASMLTAQPTASTLTAYFYIFYQAGILSALLPMLAVSLQEASVSADAAKMNKCCTGEMISIYLISVICLKLTYILYKIIYSIKNIVPFFWIYVAAI